MPSDPVFIAPERVYPRAAFLAITGLGLSTVRKYRRAGIELKTLTIGQQILVRGSDGIAWLERIAEQHGTATPEPAEAAQADDGEYGILPAVEFPARLEAAS